MDRVGIHASPDWRVLDFGSGWGRITRFFLREARLANIAGLDVDPQFVTLSNQLFGEEIFHTCAPLPPSLFAAESFDLVTAFSVFSHLSETACRLWVDEFARILKPGGLFAFTTRNEWFLDFCSQVPADTPIGHMRVLRTLFADWEDVRRRFRAGEFVHTATGGGGVRDSSYYGESFIPRSYIEREYSRDFDLVMTSDAPQPGNARRAISDRNAEYDQALFILRRR
ncbi:MAG TPA: class I SAM-dependent methyltransferase [Tahibacter sp.]|uniref:class I SAM-dependent methyltransferase n=1 Tax=Tahibacter sp. TaxID=2056211 RepID=UPI002C756A7B|nr:class I SAM-dependent methyltransferase [Tahibacter sp.]HSX61397.1 class I SAM-dependent methyltransferase [Tahibacter sp.]